MMTKTPKSVMASRLDDKAMVAAVVDPRATEIRLKRLSCSEKNCNETLAHGSMKASLFELVLSCFVDLPV